MGENKEPKLVHRLIPCPEYNVSGTERWLSDMAEQGLMLQNDGFFWGIATFEKTAPQRIKYRCLPANKNTSFWSSDNGEPDVEEIELSKEFGWEYVVKRGEFYIYRTTDMEARELHTDKEVQALAMKSMRKRQWEYLLVSLPLCLIYFLLVFGSKLFLSMVYIGTWVYLFLVFSLLWSIVVTTVRAIKLLKLRKQMLAGVSYDADADWRKNSWKHHFTSVTGVVLSIAAVVTFLWVVLNLYSYTGQVSQKEYTGNPPFATMADFLPGGTRNLINMSYGNMNTVREWSDVLAPVNYEWDEVATITHPDGRKLSGGLEIIYHEARFPWIAKRMAREHFIKGKQEDDFELLTLKIEGMDTVYAYNSILHFPSIILQKDNKVLFARFYTTGKENIELSLEEWAGILAERMMTE